MRGAQFPDNRCCKYSTWLAFAPFDYRRQFQHWCWRRSAGSQQREFQHGSGRCCLIAQRYRLKQHSRWNRHAREQHCYGNTATGFSALFANTTGGTLETSVLGFALGPNTAIGSGALESNVDASANTAVGYNALHSQVTGLIKDPHLAANTAVGFEALANVTGSATGDDTLNTALGYQALFNLTDGEANVAIGDQAGLFLKYGDENIAVGALVGFGLTSGTGNIFIGTSQGPATEDEDVNTYIGNINFTSVSGGNTHTVTIDLSSGLLGHLTSSRRYKEDVKPMSKASEALYRLKPVTYRYRKEIDKTQSLAFGLVAEEVAEVNPDLVAHNAQGHPRACTTRW